MNQYVPGSTGGDHFLCKYTSQDETYGEHIMQDFMNIIKKDNAHINNVVDLGAGSGRDLSLANKLFPMANKIGIEISSHDIHSNVKKPDFIKFVNLNLENDKLPFASETLDICIANQVLEHTKEIFWIFHEVSRSLKVGGYFIIGVPNVASFHNRLLLTLGRHPTQFKSYSAHVRIFSKRDLVRFTDICFPRGYVLKAFAGSQFYPFPRNISRLACKLFPNASFSIFFLFQKQLAYQNQFIAHVNRAQLETPFYVGNA